MEETGINIVIIITTMGMARIIKTINKMDTRIENITITMGMCMDRITIITLAVTSSCSIATTRIAQQLLLLLPTVR